MGIDHASLERYLAAVSPTDPDDPDLRRHVWAAAYVQMLALRSRMMSCGFDVPDHIDAKVCRSFADEAAKSLDLLRDGPPRPAGPCE